ncbi:MAG: serine/threonine protein kinase, partial [Acidobacteria bacterium]|nr:serine/threonine protein kinase [Acidobacteriota bacterium]
MTAQQEEGVPEPEASPPEVPSGFALRPGQLIGRRYRIHRLLGKGSMGEVYSADNLTLGRPVALKFLPADRTELVWRLQLAEEVGVGQRVSHPNVCRVHEIGFYGERAYLSMELIRGETLERVLRRSFGQLTRDEKLNIALDLCAGLGAIHLAGVIHCDLKPSNVMLEHSGRAIITDFGLATAGGFSSRRGCGTPGYTAPEQSEAGPSMRTDLYALGVVLYELFTGDKLDPATLPEPRLPAGSEVESKVREAILQCLREKPKDRPRSAEAVADLLPQRPEPDPAREDWVVPPETLLVSPRYRPQPWVARALFGAALGALAVVPLLGSRTQVASLEDLPHPPVVLVAKAREHLASIGYGDPPRDRLYGFSLRPDLQVPFDSSSLTFWYRQSPELLAPLVPGSAFRVYDDPPLTQAGSVGVHLDGRGRLRALDAVPVSGGANGPWPEPDWSRLFAAAGLDGENLEEAVPLWTPPAFADRRKAWIARRPAGGTVLRVEAAAFHGRPVAFRFLPGEDSMARKPVGAGKGGIHENGGLPHLISNFWFLGVLVAALFLARRNFFRNRADRPAAFRLALAVLAGRSLVGVLGAEHLRGLAEVAVFQAHVARAIHAAALVWIIYVALEPFARCWWPDQTASWVRLLYGRWRDPLVGRDILVGTLFGIGAMVCSRLYVALPSWLGSGVLRSEVAAPLAWQVGFLGYQPQLEALRGLRQTLGISIFALVHGVLVA